MRPLSSNPGGDHPEVANRPAPHAHSAAGHLILPARIPKSIPHIPLIPFEFMSAKQRPKFVLKAQLAMVLFLPGNVLPDLRQPGLANRRIGMPALPLEICVVCSQASAAPLWP